MSKRLVYLFASWLLMEASTYIIEEDSMFAFKWFTLVLENLTNAGMFGLAVYSTLLYLFKDDPNEKHPIDWIFEDLPSVISEPWKEV